MRFSKSILIIVAVLASGILWAQENIRISEGTLKVGGLSQQEIYFGLSEGDELIFNFNEVKGKGLKEIEISEYPESSKFFDYEQKSITNKSISIVNTGIYKLRLKNTALSARVCRYTLERIPADSLKFNTTVYWKTRRDTTKYFVEENYLISKDTAIVSVIPNKIERVHSQTSTNGLPNRTTVQITLPQNAVSWSYYLGVGVDAEAVIY